MIELDHIFMIMTVVASGGVGWGAAQVNARRDREKLVEFGVALKDHAEKDEKNQLEAVDRLARIETKLDALLGDR